MTAPVVVCADTWHRVDDVRSSCPSCGMTDARTEKWSLDDVRCATCGGTRLDVMSCEGSIHCTVRGCECVVERNASCDRFDGLYACEDHPFPSHRGCRECDPPERDDR